MANMSLWALVVAMGFQIGAGVYEARVLVPLWSSAPPESVIAFQKQPLRPDSGPRFWIIVTPLVGLISLLNVIVAWGSTGPQRLWWLLGAGTSLVVVIVTFAFFVPILVRDLPRAGELPPAVVATKVRWWVRLNWVRVVVLLAAWLAVLKAFSHAA